MVIRNKNKWIRSLAGTVLTLVYPERCAICDRTVKPSDKGICPYCGPVLEEVGDASCLKCGKPLEDGTAEYCADCMKREHSFDRGLSLYPYSKRVAESLYRLKYSGRRSVADFYGRKMAERFGDQIAAWGVEAVIPVPLHRERLKKRGYNQAELIAGALARPLGLPVCCDMVERVSNTTALKLLSAAQREEILKNAFKISKYEVKLKAVLIVDDIYTTGSTIDEISGLLKRAGADRIFFVTAATGRM